MRTSRHSNRLDQKDGSRRGWNGIGAAKDTDP